MKALFFVLLLLGTTTLYVLASKYTSKDAVRLTDVQVLTFKKGQWTTGRRSPTIPQLTCTGGTARKMYGKVENVQCTNQGHDGTGNVQWKCESTLEKTIKLGQTVVSCEGYDYSEDPFILVGSCGLEYTLEYTDYYYDQQKQPPKPVTPVIIHHTKEKNSTADALMFLGIVMLVVCLFLCCSCQCVSPSRRTPPTDFTDPPVRDDPVYIGPQTVYQPVPTPTTTTFVVDNSADAAHVATAHATGFTTGMMVGATLASATQPVTTTTTIIQPPQIPQMPPTPPTETYSRYDSDSSPPRQRTSYGGGGGTYTSTSYGDTKRR